MTYQRRLFAAPFLALPACAMLIFLCGGRAVAAEWQTVLQADLAGGVIAVNGTPENPGSEVSGTVLGNLYLAPALRFSNGDILDPLVFANSDGQSRPIDEDVLYVRSYTVGIRPTFTLPLGTGGWSAGARILAEHVWNQDALGQALGQGLYDYEEYGAGLILKREVAPLATELTLDGSYRDYPNYQVPGSDLTEGKDYYQLDSWWWRAALRHRDQVGDGRLLTFAVRFSIRDYTDNYVVNQDGTLDFGRKQVDYGAGAELDYAWRVTAAWGLDLGLGYDGNFSNQNYFDQTEANIDSFNVYTPNFEDYQDLRLDPGVHWVGQTALKNWYADVSYELLLRSTGIRIENPDGAYTDGLQADVEHGVNLTLGRLLGHGLRVHADLHARDVLSNQEFDRGALASYSYYNATLGLDYYWDTGK